MATGRIFVVALLLVALTTVSVVARPASRKQETNGYDNNVKAVGKEAVGGASPENVAASKYSDAIVSQAASKAHIRAAEKNMKRAEAADSPIEAVVAKKAAAKNMASALAYAFRGAAALAPTAADKKNDDDAAAVGGDSSAAKDVASKYSEAILSNAVSKAYIRAAEKNMEEAEVADTPEEAAVAKKAASKNMAAAMLYAYKGAAAVAPPAADAATKDGEAAYKA